MENSFIAILYNHRTNIKTDIEIPLDITAQDLVVGLNAAYNLGIDIQNSAECFLRSEHPIAFLKGYKVLSEYGLHDGTVIHFL